MDILILSLIACSPGNCRRRRAKSIQISSRSCYSYSLIASCPTTAISSNTE
ncbi:unnamed protein product [Nippostrongylus brasiliensis]|uniref:Uncharacterized protein n=1 Tax=Nippostrongylus brasiliensis TaxID=27835 RepID=A0A0N4XYU0_NIPBR|nr:unnamed protein product [Nippostrongylus brasiliensis]